MVKNFQEDIFSSINKNLIVTDSLSLEFSLDSSFQKIKIPNHFKMQIESFSEDINDYEVEIKKSIYNIKKKSIEFGYSKLLYIPIYESVLNAHQHGNNLSSSKKVFIGSNITNEKLEIIVADEGRNLPKKFIPFILKFRRNPKIFFIDWYEYSSQIKNNVNHGVGTSFINVYMDEVKYYLSEDSGGLGIYIVKELIVRTNLNIKFFWHIVKSY